MRLILGSPQVEEQLASLAIAIFAFVAVGYDRARSIAGQTTLNRVLSGSAERKLRLELEAHGGGGARGNEYVVGQGVGCRSA
jgi:hypothetical protein